MFTRNAPRSSNRVWIDSLEQRTLLSTPVLWQPAAATEPDVPAVTLRQSATRAASVPLLKLLAFDKLGAHWAYNSTYTIVSTQGNKSGSGAFELDVDPKRITYSGHPSSIITAHGNGSKLILGMYSDSTGTYVALNKTVTGLGTMTAKLTGTRLAPAKMVNGTSYSDAGTFKGTLSGKVGAVSFTGTLSGTSTGSAKLIGPASVTVPAGTYNATRGTLSVKLNGKVAVKYLGLTVPGTITATSTQTFWVVSGTGIVRAQTIVNIKVTIPGVTTQSAKITTDSKMTSFHL